MAQPDWLDDKQDIAADERGVRSGHRHELSLTVRFDDARGGVYQLPACGHAGIGEFFRFDWLIDWGDGTDEHVRGISSSFGGEVSQGNLVHTYGSDGTYRIVIRPANSPSKTEGTAPGWLQAFGYTDKPMYDGTTREKLFPKGVDNLIEVDGILDDCAINIELEGACGEMFADCKNITMGPSFTFDSDKTRAGNFFCYKMFWSCCGDNFAMGNNFKLPQSLQKVGEAFCCEMFFNCRGSSFTMNDSFTLPQFIQEVGTAFCRDMFGEHGPAFTMGAMFNLPQGIVAIGNAFCAEMFQGCGDESVFEMNEQFNLPQRISGHVGSGFCRRMFALNKSDSFTMNDVFNLPQGITDAGASFCSQMFLGCSGRAFSMNQVFNIPPILGHVGDDGLMMMFSDCDGSSFQLNERFSPPDMTGGNHLAYGMFDGCRLEALNWRVKSLIASKLALNMWFPPY